MKDLISIIVPVYNVSLYVETCLNSLLRQTYDRIEVIVVDDGSTDGSGEICDKYAEKYENKIKVIHTENRGLSAARNKGLENTKGKYIAFVDSDDWIEPETIEKLYELLVKNDADLSSCGIYKDYEEENVFLQKHERQKVVAKKQMFHEILCNEKVYGYVWNKLYKKSLIESLCFDESLLSQEDMDFTMKYLKKCTRCTYDEGEYYHYRQREGSMTNELGYSIRKLSIIEVYERAIAIYKEQCPEDLFIVERNYVKLNINILGRMKISKYKNKELKHTLIINTHKYLKKVMRDKQNFLGVKVNILVSYLFPKTMIKIKYKLLAHRRKI